MFFFRAISCVSWAKNNQEAKMSYTGKFIKIDLTTGKHQVGETDKSLLKKYHAKKEELEFAEDNMEEHWIEEDLEKYRVEIKACVAKIRALESAEEAQSASV